jgi:hypothetical protein
MFYMQGQPLANSSKSIELCIFVFGFFFKPAEFLSWTILSISMLLDLENSLLYPKFMNRILGFLFSLLLISAGVGSVPRCYVMEPHCAVRGTSRCPLAHRVPVTAEKGCAGCPHPAQNSARQQKPRTIPPVDRLARFTIDQERHNPDISLDCLPIIALVQNALLSSVIPVNDRETFPARLTTLPEPPLLILFQKQSFLI